MERLKKFEIWSAVGTIVIGSLLHFVYGWSGNLKPVAFFGAVNESTWEHLKLAFWPAFIFSAIAYYSIGRNVPNFCLAQAKKLFVMPVFIILVFYASLATVGDFFLIDIANFIVAVILGHILAYRLETARKVWGFKTISAMMTVLLLLAFSLFTYFPPKNFLFKDPVLGGYGIEK